MPTPSPPALRDEIRELLRTPRVSLTQDLALSRRIDALLGLDVAATERELLRQKPADARPLDHHWIGLRPEALQTGYLELAEFLPPLRERFPGATWFDFGCAYGRLGIVLALLAPECAFRGYEIVPERTFAGQAAYARLGLDPAQLRVRDIESFVPAEFGEARIFFVYDFGPHALVTRCLEKLKARAAHGAVAVVARGRGTQHWIDREHPWLSGVNDPQRFTAATIYFS